MTASQTVSARRPWMAAVVPLSLCAMAFLLRLHFFSGFILGDDPINFGVVQDELTRGPHFRGIVEMRWTKWLVQAAVMNVLGVSETSFFLPIWLLSSGLSVIGYGLLRRWGYAVGEAWLAGAFIATAPFEILSGTLLTNDLFMAWPLNLALFVLVRFDRRPVLQGSVVATLLWLAFYGKLSAVCAVPAVGFYYVWRGVKERDWRGGRAFAVVYLGWHGLTELFWKATLGRFFPLAIYSSPTYPVAWVDVPKLFLDYPRFLFKGSEFGTTLFGVVPYLLAALLAVKAVVSLRRSTRACPMAFDRWDVFLGAYYAVWFLLLNFFPETFHFDRYYSVTRIFRYLTPLSFPMTLHVGKMLLDLARWRSTVTRPLPSLAAVIIVPCVVLNVFGAAEATRPGRIYRRSLLGIVHEIERQCPSQVVAESWPAFFLRSVYVREACGGHIEVVDPPPETIDTAEKHERWLADHEADFPEGTFLVTGLASYVHYGCHGCGFRLRKFRERLSPRWRHVGEYGVLTYLPLPEPARLWRLTNRAEKPAAGP